MKDFIVQYWVEFLFAIAISIMGGSMKKLKKKLGEQEAIKLGVQALLRDRIIRQYTHYTEKGFCPIYARENINALAREYHALNGNGVVDDLLEKLSALPTQPENKE